MRDSNGRYGRKNCRLVKLAAKDLRTTGGCTQLYLLELSQRELEALRLAARGLVNKEIADVMSISIETAKFHIVWAMCRLGARSRTHAVAIGFARGILNADDLKDCGERR